jgi:hypothetical protein
MRFIVVFPDAGMGRGSRWQGVAETGVTGVPAVGCFWLFFAAPLSRKK